LLVCYTIVYLYYTVLNFQTGVVKDKESESLNNQKWKMIKNSINSQKKDPRPITEAELRKEIMKRICRRIAISSSLENFSHTNEGDVRFYYHNRDRTEPDTQFNMKL